MTSENRNRNKVIAPATPQVNRLAGLAGGLFVMALIALLAACTDSPFLVTLQSKVAAATASPAAPTALTPVETPVISPTGKQLTDTNISITSATPGASIFYTTNNTNPSSASTLYTNPIPLTGNNAALNLKAIAIKTGMADSAVASASINVQYEALAVTTAALSAVAYITATSGGNVTLVSGPSPTARGVCWTTSAAIDPIFTDAHTNDGTGSGAFVSNLTGLAAGTTYYVRAYATNSLGTVYGLKVAFTTKPPTPTGTPTVTAADSTSVSLSWSPVTGATGYKIFYKTGTTATNADTPAPANPVTSGTSATVTGLTSGTQYGFAVVATNASGDSPAAGPSVSTWATPVLTVSSKTSTSISLSWNAAANATLYKVFYKPGSAATITDTQVSAGMISGTTATITGLTVHTQYGFVVVASDGALDSLASAPVTAVTPTNAPTGLTVTSENTNSISLSWTAPSYGATGYKVFYAAGNTASTSSSQASAGMISGTTATVTGLPARTEYAFLVVPVYAGVDGVASPVVKAVTTSPNIAKLRVVPAGTFQRNATSTNLSSVSRFYMSQTLITRAQFMAVSGSDPSDPSKSSNGAFSSSPDDPAQRVNWYQAIAFCNKLSILEGLSPVYAVSGVNFSTLAFTAIPLTTDANWNAATINVGATGYRLPTEMEWLWAAMGASSDAIAANMVGGVNVGGYLKGYAGSSQTGGGVGGLSSYAWYNNSKTSPVGTKTANELGLYDMSGNVNVWNWDWAASHPAGSLSDYQGPATGTSRVTHAGSISNSQYEMDIATARNVTPETRSFETGLRVVLSYP